MLALRRRSVNRIAPRDLPRLRLWARHRQPCPHGRCLAHNRSRCRLCLGRRNRQRRCRGHGGRSGRAKLGLGRKLMRRRRSTTRRSGHKDTSILPNPKHRLDRREDPPRQRQPLTSRSSLPLRLRPRRNPQQDITIPRHNPTTPTRTQPRSRTPATPRYIHADSGSDVDTTASAHDTTTYILTQAVARPEVGINYPDVAPAMLGVWGRIGMAQPRGKMAPSSVSWGVSYPS